VAHRAKTPATAGKIKDRKTAEASKNNKAIQVREVAAHRVASHSNAAASRNNRAIARSSKEIRLNMATRNHVRASRGNNDDRENSDDSDSSIRESDR